MPVERSNKLSLGSKIAAGAGKIAGVGTLAAIGFIGERGMDGGFIRDIWQMLKQASPAAACLLFLLLLDERRERREAQRQCNERTLDYINSTNLMSKTFGRAIEKRRNNRT